MVTLPPSDSSTQPLIGRVAVPWSVTTAVAPSLVPVSGTTDQHVMPDGKGVRERFAEAALTTDSSVSASWSRTPPS